MKNNIITGLAFSAMIMLSSCFGQHNQAPSKGLNLDSKRIYGEKGAPAKQLGTPPPKDPEKEKEMKARAAKIREKLYPKSK